MYMAKNNGVTFINHRIRDKGKKINLFDKVNSIKQDIKKLIPEIEEDKLLPMFSNIRNFYYTNIKKVIRNSPIKMRKNSKLTTNEQIVLDYLLKNNLNPSTTYRWFVACRVPADIKEKLEQGKISYRKAVMIADNRKKSRLSNTGLLMIEEINNIVRSL